MNQEQRNSGGRSSGAVVESASEIAALGHCENQEVHCVERRRLKEAVGRCCWFNQYDLVVRSERLPRPAKR